MTKYEFIDRLRAGLSEVPRREAEEHLTFYTEMIEDCIEDGMSEEEAVAQLGSAEDIIARIRRESILTEGTPEPQTPKKKTSIATILLLVLGSPLWLSLVLAAFAVILSLWISLWATAMSLWSVFASLVACGIGGVLSGAGFALAGNSIPGTAMIGAGLICMGLGIFSFFGCKYATEGMAALTKWLYRSIIKIFSKREAA